MLSWPPLDHFSSTSAAGARIVRNEVTLEEIYRLRFRRYVLEQRKQYDGANITDGLLVEDLDLNAVHLAHLTEGRIGAALRMTFLDSIGTGGYLAQLGMALSGRYPDNLIICSRFVMDESVASFRSMVSLFRLAYRIGLESGSRFSALSTREALVEHFSIFGYRLTGESFEHPVSGPQVVMVLDLEDAEHLEATRSPLLAVFREWQRGLQRA